MHKLFWHHSQNERVGMISDLWRPSHTAPGCNIRDTSYRIPAGSTQTPNRRIGKGGFKKKS
jgi:hypothetical protein